MMEKFVMGNWEHLSSAWACKINYFSEVMKESLLRNHMVKNVLWIRVLGGLG